MLKFILGCELFGTDNYLMILLIKKLLGRR